MTIENRKLRERSKYAAEFHAWRRAPAEDKDGVAFHQVFTSCLGGDNYFAGIPELIAGIVTGNLEMMTPCGKRLADCKPDDIDMMVQWQAACVRALGRLGKQLFDPNLTRDLDDSRATIIRLIQKRAGGETAK